MRRLTIAGVCGGLLTACPPADDDGSDGLSPATWNTALEAGPEIGVFLSVWGPSSDDVWAVGGQVPSLSEPGTGAIQRRQGGTWAAVDVPSATPLLNWVHGTSNRVWVVGNAGAALFYDGSDWTTTDTGVDVALWGCWVVSDDDVWAVGGDALDPAAEPVIVHYDGSGWTTSDLPALDRTSNALFKVWAAAADDVWAVGDAGVILHYDGNGWTQVGSGTGNDLISLWGTGADNILAVGGRSNGTLSRWDGTAWTSTEIGSLAGLNGVWMHPDGNAAIAGNGATAGLVYAPDFEAELEDSGAGIMVLHGIIGFEDGERIAVGGTLDRSPPYFGIIIETQ